MPSDVIQEGAMPVSLPTTEGTKPTRLQAVDALRGLIIILMALDHANLFIAQKHATGEYWGGPYPAYYDVLAFLTRLLTHPTAPGFSFLMGVGMALFANSRLKRGWSRWQVMRFLIVRGLILVALQFLVVNRAWELAPTGWGLEYYYGVLVALGGGMIIGSLFLWFRPAYLLALAVILMVGTELLTPGPDQWGADFSLSVSVLFIPSGSEGWWVNYPILQWLELVIFGLGIGYLLTTDPYRTYRRALLVGAAFLAVFFLIRYLDGFGNIRLRTGDSWMDYLYVIKYPPSIAFTMLTMGFNLLVLGILAWLFDKFSLARRFAYPLVVIGAVPLFFYVTHLFLYAALGYLLAPAGTSIANMYLYWLLGLLLLYPFCLWYGQLKRSQPASSALHFI